MKTRNPFIELLRKAGVDPQAFIKGTQKLHQTKYCLHPEASNSRCKGGIIKAHSVSRAGSLENVAEDGHVLTFLRDPFSQSESNPYSAPKRIGINSASTFTGFCAFHDNRTFEPIDSPRIQLTNETVFKMSYRAVCRELYYKRAGIGHLDLVREITPNAQHYIGDYLESQQAAYEMGERDLVSAKTAFDDLLATNDYSYINYYAVMFSSPLNLVGSGAVTTDIDFDGRVLQTGDNPSRQMSYTAVNLFPIDGGGCFIISWLGDVDGVNRRLTKSLSKTAPEKYADAAIRFIFEYSENVYLRPSWWEKLGTEIQHRLLERMHEGGYQNGERSRDCLQDDRLNYDTWSDVEIVTNCGFMQTNAN